jgi:RHS repeat-associated protein
MTSNLPQKNFPVVLLLNAPSSANALMRGLTAPAYQGMMDFSNGLKAKPFGGTSRRCKYDSASNLLRRYMHGPGVDQPLVWYESAVTTNKTWLYSDHQGSITATANSAGTSTVTLSYGPYGEPNATTGVRFRYTGQQLIGPLNLYYYKARLYSPAIDRFLQTDPIGYQDNLNQYAYVGNNPFNRNDPSGLKAADMQMLGGKLGGELTSFPVISANYSSTRSYESARADINSVLGIVGVGSVTNISRVAAATGEVSALLESYRGPGGGHHVPAKSAFTGAENYGANIALAIPNAELASLGVSHSAVTGAQMTGYQAFAKTGETLTWGAMSAIEANALVRGGMAESMANTSVNQAIQASKDAGVSGPTRIPRGR